MAVKNKEQRKDALWDLGAHGHREETGNWEATLDILDLGLL